MMLLWWFLIISLLQTMALPLLAFALLAVLPVRKVRILLQVIAALALFYVSPLISIILLLATAIGAFLETIELEYRFALTGAVFVGICFLYPGLTPPLLAYVLLGLLVLTPFLKRHFVEWRRILTSVSFALGLSFLLVFLLRLMKEALFGSVANLMRPAFEAFGSLFTWTIPLSEKVDEKMQTGANLGNMEAVEPIKQGTMNAATVQVFNYAAFGLALLVVGLMFYFLRKRRVVTVEQDEIVRPTAKKRTKVAKKHSQHPLLQLASQLEQAFPRKRDETTYEWLERIAFPEVERNARLIDGIEFSQSEPAYDLQVFRRQVRERMEE